MANRGRGTSNHNPQLVNQLSAQASIYAKNHRQQKFDCGIHAITYESENSGCPVCKLERERTLLLAQIRSMNGKIQQLEAENQRFSVVVDFGSALAEASEILDDHDREFLKLILYQFRDDKSVSLKTTKGGKRGGLANGFLVMPRHGDPYGHPCTSIGGRAIASIYDEIIGNYGPAQAMIVLVRGLSSLLPGSSR